MNDLSILLNKLEKTADSKEKLRLLSVYFSESSDIERLTTLAILLGKTPKKILGIQQLKELVIDFIQIPKWLFEDSFNAIGDLAETIASIIEHPNQFQLLGSESILAEIQSIQTEDTELLKFQLYELLCKSTVEQRYTFIKLLTGTYKSPVSRRIVYKAISTVSKLDYKTLAIRLSASWELNSTSWEQLIFTEYKSEIDSFAFPFRTPIGINIIEIKDISEFLIEWNYHGERVQLVKRNDQCFLWSKKSELITELFPEIVDSAYELPDGTVIDGIVVAKSDGIIQPKSVLNSRLNRKRITEKLMNDIPILFIAFDLLENNTQDQRSKKLSERKLLLESILSQPNHSSLSLAKCFKSIHNSELQELANSSRVHGANGIVLKAKDSTYIQQKHDKHWLKLAPTAITVNAVLIYASSSEIPSKFQFTEFTFALWEADKLIPIAKTSQGFTDEQLDELNEFVKSNTIEKFGPVRSLFPLYVFMLKFDDIQKSSRHKSGFQLINPEVIAWQKHLSIELTNKLEDIQVLIRS